jgi:hypothetical protein
MVKYSILSSNYGYSNSPGPGMGYHPGVTLGNIQSFLFCFQLVSLSFIEVEIILRSAREDLQLLKSKSGCFPADSLIFQLAGQQGGYVN